MSQTVITGIPETITRADYMRLVESVGFDVDDLASLRFAPDGIYAVVYALNDDGNRFLDEATGEPAMHIVFVRVTDE